MSESKKTSLFGGGDEWTANACVNVGGEQYQWYIYTEGYDLAVNVLVEHAVANRCVIDALIYPIVFTARHSIELRLKHIHRVCCTFLNQEYKLPSHHNISKLWTIVKPLVMKVLPNEDYSDFAYIDDIVFAVNLADNASFAFRYPMDKKGGKSLEPNARHVNICEFHERYSKAAEALEGIYLSVAYSLENEVELRSHLNNSQ
ncbi:MAG: hypothetical protein AAFW67_06605 [Cyanobacteria bacterium J06638_38]